MKYIFLFVLLLLGSSGRLAAQRGFPQLSEYCRMQYLYDDAGNRTQRKVVCVNPPRGIDCPHCRYGEGGIGAYLYPNPTSGVFTIDFDMIDDKTKVTISNLYGIPLLSRQVNSFTENFDISLFPAGTYLVTIILNGEAYQNKLTKM